MRAISAFNFEAGMSTVSCAAWIALRMRVRKSAMGSVMDIRGLCVWSVEKRSFAYKRNSSKAEGIQKEGSYNSAAYQEDFVIPGIKPLWASSRRQMRQIPNLRYTEGGGRPRFE